MALNLPPDVAGLFTAQKALIESFPNLGLKFTPDGKIIGDIGKALASHHFGVTIKRVPPFHGFVGNSGVIIRATGKKSHPLRFSSDYKGVLISKEEKLLVFEIDYEEAKAEIIFNGPFVALFRGRNSAVTIKNGDLQKLNNCIEDNSRITALTQEAQQCSKKS